MAPDWKTTKLWLLLAETCDRDPGRKASAARLRSRLELMMPDIVAVLSGGDTAASDFTLHDEGHGFRVAERMVDVLTPAEPITSAPRKRACCCCPPICTISG